LQAANAGDARSASAITNAFDVTCILPGLIE
jgi:hypothetical protein